MTHTSSKKEELARDFENIILAWSSGISGEQHNKLPPEARELVSMLVSSSTRITTKALKELKEEVIGEVPSKMNTNNWKYDKRVAELKLWQHQAIDNKIKELEEV